MKKEKINLTIGFVLDDGLDSADGVQQYILTLGGWLSSEGHEVHYLVGETRRTDIPHVHSLASNVEVRFNGNTLTIPKAANSSDIRNFLNREQFDVLHIQVPYSPLFGAKVVKNAEKHTVVIGTFHILPYGWFAFVATYVLGFALRSNLKRFDAQVAVSAAAQTFASKTFRISSKVVPNMVNIEKFRTKTTLNIRNPDNGVIRLVFVGRLVKRKGCTYLIDALGKMTKNQPGLKFELKVCGKGEMLKDLEQRVASYGLEDRVEFLGFVSEEEKIAHLQAADIAVFPSYSGESFGIVLLEAMAAGSNVVLGGKNPGYESVLGDIEGSIVDVRNPKAFSERLQQLIEDGSLRHAIHKQQQSKIKEYDVSVVANQVLALYRDCKKLRTTG